MSKIVAGKLHGIHVTEADRNYRGAITLAPDDCEAAGIPPMEFIEIWNKNSRGPFNIAIQTLTQKLSGPATFGVGSGQPFDSKYDECLLKAAALAECAASRHATHISEIEQGKMP